MATRALPTSLAVFLLREKLVGELRRQTGAFERLARAARKKLRVEQVHDLRVLTRRLRAALWLAWHLAPRKRFRKARRDLKALGRVLGARRLLDVAVQDAAKYGLPATACMHERVECGARLAWWLAPARRQALVAILKRAGTSVAAAAEDRLAKGLAQRAKRIDQASLNARRSREGLHRLRIEAKKTRYVLELLERKASKLKMLQGYLGRAHDLEVLQQLLGYQERVRRDEVRTWKIACRWIAPALKEASRELAAAAFKLQER